MNRRSTLEKSSKEYFQEIVETVKEGNSKTKKFDHLVLFEGYDPREVTQVTDNVHITAHDGVMDAVMKLHYVINVTEDLESIANLQIGIRAYEKDIQDDLDLIALAIHQKVKRGWSVTVHCAMGMERSCLAVAWYLGKYGGLMLDEAYELIRERRPIAVDRREYLDTK
jgi:hypothetical protein